MFLNGIVQFERAVLSLSDPALVIEYFDTLVNADSHPATVEKLACNAPDVAMLEEDIGRICY